MRKSVGIALLSLMISAAGAATVYAAGWQQGAGGWWYEYEDGSYAKSGIRQIGEIGRASCRERVCLQV